MTCSRSERMNLVCAGAFGVLLGAGGAVAEPGVQTLLDEAGPAVIRRTDVGNDGLINPEGVLPNLLSVTTSTWHTATAATDPYNGSAPGGPGAGLGRIEAVFEGLINPPGTLGVGGPYAPYTYGPSPAYGFIEFDVDGDADTGGELSGVAANRYLGVVCRFGGLPVAPVTARAAVFGENMDPVFVDPPQFERSGTDFTLALCGCFATTIVSQDGDLDGVFDAGETWIVRGRFFQRVGGYKNASLISGGSQFGQYDPLCNLRFSHSAATNQTTVTLIFALNQAGAAALLNQPVQPIDTSIAGSSHASVEECLTDVVAGAGRNPADLPTRTLIQNWLGRTPSDYLDPSLWRVTAIIGTAYTVNFEGPYVWTDAAFGFRTGDMTGDGAVNNADRTAVQDSILALDGAPYDGDGVIDGVVTITPFGPDFALYDLDGNGLINELDIAALNLYIDCLADFNESGVVDADDIFVYLEAWFAQAPSTDVDADSVVDADDLFAFLAVWFAGCP